MDEGGDDEDLEDIYESVDGQQTEEEEWRWTLTNIGAAMFLIGLMLLVLLFVTVFTSGLLIYVYTIPAVLLMGIGYALIVKDYLANRGNG